MTAPETNGTLIATVEANTCSPSTADAEQAGPLSADEKAALRSCEDAIHNGLKAIWKMAEALKQIRDGKLFRATHRTFEAYVEERWDFGIRRAQQILSGYDVKLELEAAGIEDLPVSEAQIRPLKALPVSERAEVWTELVGTTPTESITKADVETAVKERIGVPAVRTAKPVPDPDEAWQSWPREAKRALKVIPEKHRERFADTVNAITDSPTADDVNEAAVGYAAAVLEDGTSAPAVVAGEALALVDDAPAVDVADEEPLFDIPILEDEAPVGHDAATKRNVTFLGAAQRRPLLVSIPRTLLPRRLQSEVPEGVPVVIVEMGELERSGGPVRSDGALEVDVIREAARDAGMGAQFTRTNEHVDWARYTINPLTGCWHSCRSTFCYAAGIAQRLFPQGFIPTLYPARLDAFAQTRMPDVSNMTDEEAWRERSVFNTSMGDLFGTWVPDWYIEQVLEAVGANPGWFSFFLTKNPGRLAGFTFPANCAVGITITGEEGGTHRHADVEKQGQIYAKSAEALAGVKGAEFTWLSVEPFRAEVFDLSPFVDAGVRMVAVGGQSRTRFCKAEQPDIRWLESVRRQVRGAGISLFEKENLTVRPKEIPFPTGHPMPAPHLCRPVRVATRAAAAPAGTSPVWASAVLEGTAPTKE